MQIPTNFSAAQAVSIASIVSSRDNTTSAQAASATAPQVQLQLEKSESASPDRDAQGQGDGLGHHARKQPEDAAELENSAQATSPSNEPPDLLDLVC